MFGKPQSPASAVLGKMNLKIPGVVPSLEEMARNDNGSALAMAVGCFVGGFFWKANPDFNDQSSQGIQPTPCVSDF